MNNFIKRTLSAILFLSCAICLNAEVRTYDIVTYSWGHVNSNGRKNITWSKLKKVDYKIQFDNNEKNPTVSITEKKKTHKYRIISWDDKRTPEVNKTNDGWTMRECKADNEFGHRCMIIFREHEDGRIFIYVQDQSGTVYAYGTTRDGINLFESDTSMSDGHHIF